MKSQERKPIRHGELMLIPIESFDMRGSVKKSRYIVSHSETGHHHVIAGNCMVLERDGMDTILELENNSEIEHIKSFDKHDTLPLKRGIYRSLKKQEYDPFLKAMREVWD